MSDFSEDLSPDKPVRNIYIGKTPIDAIYEGEKLLWPRDDSEINPQSLSELMEKRPTKQLTAEEFAALESRDSHVIYVVELRARLAAPSYRKYGCGDGEGDEPD